MEATRSYYRERMPVNGEVSLYPENFPEPILQIEIDARVPWLLEIENGYAVESRPADTP